MDYAREERMKSFINRNVYAIPPKAEYHRHMDRNNQRNHERFAHLINANRALVFWCWFVGESLVYW